MTRPAPSPIPGFPDISITTAIEEIGLFWKAVQWRGDRRIISCHALRLAAVSSSRNMGRGRGRGEPRPVRPTTAAPRRAPLLVMPARRGQRVAVQISSTRPAKLWHAPRNATAATLLPRGDCYKMLTQLCCAALHCAARCAPQAGRGVEGEQGISIGWRLRHSYAKRCQNEILAGTTSLPCSGAHSGRRMLVLGRARPLRWSDQGPQAQQSVGSRMGRRGAGRGRAGSGGRVGR